MMVSAAVPVHVEDVKSGIVVLLVGGVPETDELVRSALARAQSDVAIIAIHDEAEALGYLHNCVSISGRRLPDLVLMAVDGDVESVRAFFSGLREQTLLGSLPVCLLAPELDVAQKRAFYRAGANAIVERIDTLDSVSEVLNTVVEFWFEMAQRAYIE